MDYHSRNLRGIAMESSNDKNHDAAIQRLIDHMRIPAENRSAVASTLLQLIKRYKALVPDRASFQDNKNRLERISKLCDDVLKELDGLAPTFKRLISEPKHSAAIRSLRAITCYPAIKRPAHRPRGFEYFRFFEVMVRLFEVQKEHGGRLLTLTNKSGEASGSLPAAHKILHQFLPSIVPSRISYQTLNRMRRQALDRIGIP
jgi:hypothetical protein